MPGGARVQRQIPDTNASNGNVRPPSTPLPAERVGIPADYATELRGGHHAMGDLRLPPERLRWEICGTRGIGVLVSLRCSSAAT
jgi:hypothetical protein